MFSYIVRAKFSSSLSSHLHKSVALFLSGHTFISISLCPLMPGLHGFHNSKTGRLF